MLNLVKEYVDEKNVFKRVYENSETHSQVIISHIYTDARKNKWFAFDDLFQVPFIRQFAAKKITDLFGSGLVLDDIKDYTKKIKAIIKVDDGEKYEKIYSEILKLEQLAESMADPVKQVLGLCTVYLMLEDERPDIYSYAESEIKMSYIEHDIDAQSFFLTWWSEVIENYGKAYSKLSQIVLTKKI